MLENKEFNPIDHEAATADLTLATEDQEKIQTENYNLSQKLAWEEFQKFSLSPEEAIAWFDAKYEAYGDTPIRLRDRDGNLLEEKHLEEISPEEKSNHSWGKLKLIQTNYNLHFIEHFLNEPELLNIAEKQGNTLKRTVQVYQDNLKKMNTAS
ncbi:MAG: hypothetical protein WC523_01545 [Patescibacteria group bacterium]|jgi:hypothetical protein